MKDVNQIILTGRIGSDLEMQYVGNDKTPLLKFSLASNKYKQGETNWFNVECWKELANIILKIAKKGSKILVIGEFDIKKYPAKDGTNKKAHTIKAKEIQILSGFKEKEVAKEVAEVADIFDAEEISEEDMPF